MLSHSSSCFLSLVVFSLSSSPLSDIVLLLIEVSFLFDSHLTSITEGENPQPVVEQTSTESTWTIFAIVRFH